MNCRGVYPPDEAFDFESGESFIRTKTFRPSVHFGANFGSEPRSLFDRLGGGDPAPAAFLHCLSTVHACLAESWQHQVLNHLTAFFTWKLPPLDSRPS